MKQVLQNLGTGLTEVIDTPCPQIQEGQILIKTSVSLISTGTERAAITQSQQGIVKKVLNQPQKIAKAWTLFKNEGFESTLGAIQKQFDFPITMGYSNVGTVIGIGAGVSGYQIGDRVLSNGPHAEIVNVPKNLCAKIPEKVSDETAAFGVLSSIALQGVRLVKPTLGETVAVMGLGVIGLLTVQILRANGCQVIALDPNQERVKIAQSYGAKGFHLSANSNPLGFVQSFTENNGVDAVIITAATDSNQPIEQSAAMSRKRGRIVLTGVAGLDIDRNLFYQKELTFQVSCSYGPGRYEKNYEEKGLDYPLPFIRWTEQRNLRACLQLMKDEKIIVSQLHNQRFPVSEIAKAYEQINSAHAPLTVLLDYPKSSGKEKRTIHLKAVKENTQQKCQAAVIGIGNYSKSMIIPKLQECNADIITLASKNGLSATLLAKKLGLSESTTDIDHLYERPDINTLFIATQHNTHAQMVCKALENNKNVFVEKPLCLNENELKNIENAYKKNNHPHILVGYNRRFSPFIQKIKTMTSNNKQTPQFIQMNINAGFIPADHWTQDLSVGGGRLLGEACHFIDLSRYIADCEIKNITAKAMHSEQNSLENTSITIEFKNGSLASINYYANGDRSFPKESIQVSHAGAIYSLNDFKSLEIFNKNKKTKHNLKKQDKGQKEMFRQFVLAIAGEREPLISFNEIYEVAYYTLKAHKQIS